MDAAEILIELGIPEVQEQSEIPKERSVTFHFRRTHSHTVNDPIYLSRVRYKSEPPRCDSSIVLTPGQQIDRLMPIVAEKREHIYIQLFI